MSGYWCSELQSNEELWQEVQERLNVLRERNALCGECGTLLNPEKPHSLGGMGWCIIA